MATGDKRDIGSFQPRICVTVSFPITNALTQIYRMIPEQYQGWSFVSPLPEERSDFKTRAFLAFLLSGSLPTFYLSLEELPSGQEKNYHHLILAVPYIFYDSLKSARSQPVSASTTQFSEQQLSLGNSETLPCHIPTSSQLFPQHWSYL